MRRRMFVVIVLICVCLGPHETVPAEGVQSPKPSVEQAKESASPDHQPLSASRAAREEKAIQDARRQQLAEKEAALTAKEQELKKLAAKLEAQVKALEDSKKRLDESLKSQKKVQDDKRKKMMTLIKKMRPEQAGKYMDKMDETMVISMLDQMDPKTVLKLMPYLNQPRVFKWMTDNLKGI